MKEFGNGSHMGTGIATRRDLLRGAAITLSAASYRSLAGASPNDRVNVAFIGLGAQGSGRLQSFLRHPDVNVAGLCDVDQGHLDRAVEAVRRQRGASPPAAKDFRRLLERKDVDAVMIATPDHWHTIPAVQACRAGKDVFVEKPLSRTIPEGRAIMLAARQHERITQLGNHIHNDLPNFRRVVEVVKSGMLGDIRRVYCWIRSTDKGMGKPPDGPPPKELDYDFWLGPAPRRPYNANRSHRTFRSFWDYSGGVFIDFWCHITDVAYWALDLTAPKSVSAAGGRFLEDDNGETPNVMEAVLEYPGLVLSWNVHPKGMPGFEAHHIGCIFQGSKATLVAWYEGHDLYVDGKRVPDFRRPEPSIPDSPGHIREFLDSVKSRRRTTCDVEYAYRLTKGGLLANLALRTGRRLYWDDRRETIVGDRAAQQLMQPRYRKPWRVG
jgi:predicted dehydrogenase